MRFFFLLFSSFVLFSCDFDLNSEALTVEESIRFPNADVLLWPHFEEFVKEAEKRGFEDMMEVVVEIEGAIQDIDEERVAGTCNYSSLHPETITLDQQFWQSSNTLQKELVVFHELGHCALLRDHLDACSNDRTYFSLMRSGLGDCVDNYTPNTRDYYLDELFSIYGDWFE